MRVLVTGGGGFLGAAVARALLVRGDEVAVFNRGEYPGLARAGAECLRGDLADRDAVVAACRGRDAVVHVAAKAGPGLYRPDFVRANVDGTRNVLAGCRAHDINMLVHTSSPSVVHSGGDIEGGDESLPIARNHPAPYPETKSIAERMVLEASADGPRSVALRPHLIWGPGDNHLLPRLVARNRAGRLRLPAPDKRIDTVYIDNAAAAHLLALDNLAGSAEAAGKAYFISNGEPRPVAGIMRDLLLAVGETPRIRTVRPGVALAAAGMVETVWKTLRLRSDPPVSKFLIEHLNTAHWFDLSAARRDLGYSPEVSIDEGLQRLRRAATLSAHE